MNIFKKILSYLFEVPIEKRDSSVGPQLKVLLKNGGYILDAADVNYSYDSLQKNFEKEFKSLNVAERDFESLLMLGFGTGSAIASLREKLHKNFTAVCVEKDPEVIKLGYKYFDIGRFENLEIVNADARDFMAVNNMTFDLILIDIYEGGDVPVFFETVDFLKLVKKSLNPGGLMIFNKYIYDQKTMLSSTDLAWNIKEVFGEVYFSKVNNTMLSFYD